MRIKIRKPGPKYLEIKIFDGSASIDCGWLEKKEAKELLEHLQDVIIELENFIRD